MEALEGLAQFEHRKTTLYFKKCVLLATFGGTFFGFDQSVVANTFALPQFTNYFNNPNADQQGNIVIFFVVGGLVGAFLAGLFSDRYGRLTVIGSGVIVFTIGAAILTAAVSVDMFEISPASKRGRYTSASNVMEDLGFALISWVSFIFSFIYTQASWRLIFGCQFIGSIVLMIGVYVIPSSPRWLALKDRPEECLDILAKLRSDGDKDDSFVKAEHAQILSTVRTEVAQATSNSYLELLKPGPNLRRFTLALCLSAMQQFTGINAITYYAPEIFKSAGITNYHNQILLNAGNTTFAFLVSISALYTLDKYGRRPVLIIALCYMVTLWIMIGLLLKFYPASATDAVVPHGFIVLFIWLFNGTYVSSWGPCGWCVPMEILPTNLRAKGGAISFSFTWLYNLCVSKTTPLLFATIGYKTYFYYAGLCFLSLLITLLFLPETQGLSLEELDALFENAPYIVWLGKYRVNTAQIVQQKLEFDKEQAMENVEKTCIVHVDNKEE